jgi:hypothetical protein
MDDPNEIRPNMSEIIIYINGKAYEINRDYKPPENSCLNCFYYSVEKGTCGTILIRTLDGQKRTRTRHSECQRDGPKAFWWPRL